MEITYGIDTPLTSEKYIERAEEALEEMLQAGVPDAYMVDSWPCLKFIPEWVPGAAFQRKARECRNLTQRVLEEPFAETLKKMVRVVEFIPLHYHNGTGRKLIIPLQATGVLLISLFYNFEPQ